MGSINIVIPTVEHFPDFTYLVKIPGQGDLDEIVTASAALGGKVLELFVCFGPEMYLHRFGSLVHVKRVKPVKSWQVSSATSALFLA
jgi:hypothetical protein